MYICIIMCIYIYIIMYIYTRNYIYYYVYIYISHYTSIGNIDQQDGALSGMSITVWVSNYILYYMICYYIAIFYYRLLNTTVIYGIIYMYLYSLYVFILWYTYIIQYHTIVLIKYHNKPTVMYAILWLDISSTSGKTHSCGL